MSRNVIHVAFSLGMGALLAAPQKPALILPQLLQVPLHTLGFVYA
jgi:ubiquinone biosynthesis protein Coq4